MSRDALVVGINVYQHLPSLNAPAHDAEAVARCLESFGECRVLRMPEAICHQKPAISQQSGVTTPMLEEALIRLFKPAGKNIPQTAIFYYSGHGLQRHAGIQEGYLATSDANPTAGHYGLSLYWLRRLLQESPVRQRVIILDCCNSGEFFNILEADPGAKAGTDRLFMAASREYEAAYEALDGSHSVFTKALLAGLNPYKVKGGLVNGHSLTDAVTRQLKGELQQPLFESSGGEIVLTRLAGVAPAIPGPTKTSTLEQLKHLSYGFCPFQGLAPFDTSHASLFFGREALTQTLVEQVSDGRFCALIGASGVGKTSLLRAGLIHHLNQQSLSDRHPNWDIRYLTPGPAPLTSLAEAFVDPEVKGIQRAEQ
ncbi:MAG TPA: caspase family protein, partial [Leptolyngbyaceae cyanobacterium M65_K2018_010]|nr:caspase family protein [Leptolyngbyaceae cyanobacterium M65_K2018_010]